MHIGVTPRLKRYQESVECKNKKDVPPDQLVIISRRSLARPNRSATIKKRAKPKYQKKKTRDPFTLKPHEMSLTAKWATQQEAAAALNISVRTLHRLRNKGLLPAGESWIRKIPSNLNSHVIYDLAACEHYLSKATIASQIEQDRLGSSTLETV